MLCLIVNTGLLTINCRFIWVRPNVFWHLGKTECLLFGSKKRLKACDDFRITCDGRTIDRVVNVRYLGVQLDSNLNGSCHVDKTLKHVLLVCLFFIVIHHFWTSNVDAHYVRRSYSPILIIAVAPGILTCPKLSKRDLMLYKGRWSALSMVWTWCST